MSIGLLPADIGERYELHEWRHACAILSADFPDEWRDLLEVLRAFRLLRSEIVKPGGGKSAVSSRFDTSLYSRGWLEKPFDTRISIDGKHSESPTHKVDCFKNGVALEVEWNNKDPFFDRDLNNFRLLFELRAVDVGIIVTRSDELQELFDSLGKGKSYGQATTHWKKVLPKIQGGGGGGCPILLIGLTKRLYEPDA
jgi:hypothetical protein